MKFLPVILLFLVLTLNSLPTFGSHEMDKGSQDKLNQFVDYMLSACRKMVVENHVQPFPIPDIRKGFRKRYFGARISGEATLFNGSITKGLESVTRTGPTTLVTKRNSRGSKRKLSVEFELRNLVIDENFKLKFMKMGPKGGMEIKMDYVRLFIEVVVKTRSHKGNNNINIKLGRVDIVDFSPFEFSLDSLGPFNFFLKVFTSVVARLCKKAILRSIWSAVTQLLTEVINETTGDSSFGLEAMMMKFL